MIQANIIVIPNTTRTLTAVIEKYTHSVVSQACKPGKISARALRVIGSHTQQQICLVVDWNKNIVRAARNKFFICLLVIEFPNAIHLTYGNVMLSLRSIHS